MTECYFPRVLSQNPAIYSLDNNIILKKEIILNKHTRASIFFFVSNSLGLTVPGPSPLLSTPEKQVHENSFWNQKPTLLAVCVCVFILPVYSRSVSRTWTRVN